MEEYRILKKAYQLVDVLISFDENVKGNVALKDTNEELEALHYIKRLLDREQIRHDMIELIDRNIESKKHLVEVHKACEEEGLCIQHNRHFRKKHEKEVKTLEHIRSKIVEGCD